MNPPTLRTFNYDRDTLDDGGELRCTIALAEINPNVVVSSVRHCPVDVAVAIEVSCNHGAGKKTSGKGWADIESRRRRGRRRNLCLHSPDGRCKHIQCGQPRMGPSKRGQVVNASKPSVFPTLEAPRKRRGFRFRRRW